MLKLFKPAYIDKIFAKYYLNLIKLYNTSIKEVILFPNKKQEVMKAKKERSQIITESLMFLIVETWLDIAFATSVVTRFAKNPP